VSTIESATTAGRTCRPILHFTARDSWLNDPNGLIVHKGVYHLYYQNRPVEATFDEISWGHATSVDLVTWEEHPLAIPADERESVFSGSVVFDADNSSGLGSAEKPPLVAIYASNFKSGSGMDGLQAQSLASSTDDGYTWTKYAQSPVVSRGSSNFRDPKVFKYHADAGSYWVMVAVEAEDRQVVLYRSEDLMNWEYLSSFGPANATLGLWECPDLFELGGEDGGSAWVLIVNVNPGGPNSGSAGQYFLGDFDGVTFAPRSIVHEGREASATSVQQYAWLDWGRDYYAAVSFNDSPNGRRIMIGWMNDWEYASATPTRPWQGAMSLPREVTLASENGALRLVHVLPYETRERLASGSTYNCGPVALNSEREEIPGAAGAVQVIEARFWAGGASEFGVVVRGGNGCNGTRVGIRPAAATAAGSTAGRLIVDRTASGETEFDSGFASVDSAPIASADGFYELTIIVDHCSVEVFAQHGLTVLTSLIFPAPASRAMAVFAENGEAFLERMQVITLQ
jgi:sucrose-6-phosphate hydrolase SacC (GH32 family)